MRLIQTGQRSRPRAASVRALRGCTTTDRSLECRGGAAAADRDRKAVYLFSYSIATESSGFIPSRASRNPPGSQAGLPRHMALVEWRSPGMPRIDLANTDA